MSDGLKLGLIFSPHKIFKLESGSLSHVNAFVRDCITKIYPIASSSFDRPYSNQSDHHQNLQKFPTIFSTSFSTLSTNAIPYDVFGFKRSAEMIGVEGAQVRDRVANKDELWP